MKHILEGTRVLDFSEHVSGPACTRLLAEMGAEVIKVEFTPHGDSAREMPFLKEGRSGFFVQQNRGKKSVCLDPRDSRSRDALETLVRSSDVLVENLPVGEMAQLGFGWERVRTLNPKIVMCSISAFGQTGPLSPLPGGNEVASAYTGATAITGTADGEPVLPSAAFGDVGAGSSAAGSIGYALLHAEKTGKGQHLDIAIIDVYYEAQSLSSQALTLGDGSFTPHACGSHHPVGAPLGFFRGKDISIIIMVVDRSWPDFCRVIGREDLTEQPRLATTSKRAQHTDELVEIIEAWIQSQGSDEDVIRLLQEGRITCAPVLTVAQAIEHPHLVQRGVAQKVTDPVLGDFIIPATGYRFSQFPPLELTAPFLGQHNEEVLTGLGGLASEQVQEMAAGGAIVAEGLVAPTPARRPF
jgi:crotonobetainyl-CoA:carnitine CoA-transferase CaiB-like acyl-CoA transferase